MNQGYIASIKKICWKRPKDRTSEDIETLYQITKTNKVFSSISLNAGTNLHKMTCKHLRYEFCESQQYVFLYGSVGNKFYIILNGIVGVEIPNSNKDGFTEVLELTDGDCFGELALESNKPRQASIKCKGSCHFIYLHKSDYKECMGKFIKDRRGQIVDFLYSLPSFRGFTKGTLTKISYSMKETKYKKGQIIYNEQDLSNNLYIVALGELGFYKKLRSYVDKNKPYLGKKSYEINIANIGKGEIFGEEEMPNEEVRFNSCKCCSNDATVYIVAKNV